MKKYLPRIADDVLKFKLESKGAVWIRGPKWCGKSTTAERMAKTCIYMQDEDTKAQNLELAKINPSLFLEGNVPLLIDEWQEIPFIWNQIRREIDKRDEFGQFILTGSRLPSESDKMELKHSGTGRITNMIMRPMSLFESGDSNGTVSLSKIMNQTEQIGSKCDYDLLDYAFFTARGGWPKAIGQKEKIALQQAVDYYKGLVEVDISEGKFTKKDPQRVQLLLRSYARNCATQATLPTIKKDMLTNDSNKLDEDTIRAYINSLIQMFVVEESEAWNPNLRSKTAIRTSNTRYFVDPSIGCAALGIGPEGLIKDLKTFGLLFENLCVRDLRIYSDKFGGVVKHYRDANGLECDAVITLPDGSWIAVEIKLGSSDRIEEGASNLLKLRNNISENYPKPLALIVLTAGQVAYKREDGILVIPLGCLKD